VETQGFSTRAQLVTAFDRAVADGQGLVLRSAVRQDPTLAFAESVAAGLSSERPTLDCKYLYDAVGSALYEQICDQPEYYPNRVETTILQRHASDMVRGDHALFELGSGSATKSDLLLSRLRGNGLYVPIDVSDSALQEAGDRVTRRFPALQFIGVNAEFGLGLDLVSHTSSAFVIFLGSTIGNLPPPAEARFWRSVSAALSPGDHFLLGVDLVKDPRITEAAYDDAAGVTRRFTNNLFARMNRELNAGIDLDVVKHEASYSEAREQMEIHARFEADQEVHIGPLQRTIHIDVGTRVLVEISRKFRVEERITWLAGHGLETVEVFTDPRQWFSLLLLRRVPDDPIGGNGAGG